jgi:hypothetical protein
MEKKSPVFLALLALLIATLACSFVTGDTTGVSMENLHMAFDEDGNNPTAVFAPSDVFYVVGDLNNAPAGTVVNAQWLAVQIEGYEADELIYEQTISDFTEENFTGTIYFELSSDSGWPVGEYTVVVYLDGTFVDSVPFSVQ